MKLILFILSFLLSINNISSQNEINECGTVIPDEKWETEFGKLLTNFQHNFLDYTIPVIFHVIHGGQPAGTFPNLHQQQIISQITVLNQDFEGIGYNFNTYPINAFIQWAQNQNLPPINLDSTGRVKIANINIKFCLAEKDTNGILLTEPGINRINYISKGWQNPNTFTTPQTLRAYFDGVIKPASIWNVKKYLNIWISDKNPAVQFTGYSTLPPLSTLPGISGNGEGTDSTDGIWSYASAVGSAHIFPGGIYASPNVRGRTITHEAGHYIGLRHIWGDGSCLTDYCNDTPPAFTSNTGFPVYPLNSGSCNSPSNSPNGEMYMNFMDYSADPAKYMFTYDQAVRMQTAMQYSPLRNELGTHGICNVVIGISIIENTEIPGEIKLYYNYPNPFNPETIIKYSIPVKQYVSLIIYNSAGKQAEVLKSEIHNPGLYEVKWNAESFAGGVYFYKLSAGGNTLTGKMILLK